MSLRSLVLLAALATAIPACAVTMVEPGAVTADGSVYLGWQLFKKNDVETFEVGQQLGPFTAVRFHAESATLNYHKIVIIFADGGRWEPSIPPQLGEGQWTAPIALPRGPRAIHSIVITGTSAAKHLSKLEIFGTH